MSLPELSMAHDDDSAHPNVPNSVLQECLALAIFTVHQVGQVKDTI